MPRPEALVLNRPQISFAIKSCPLHPFRVSSSFITVYILAQALVLSHEDFCTTLLNGFTTSSLAHPDPCYIMVYVMIRWDLFQNCKFSLMFYIQFSRSVMSNSLLPMNCSTPGLPVHYQLPELTQTHVHIRSIYFYHRE